MNKLPFNFKENNKLLKRLILVNKILAELKGVSKLIPNQEILLNTLSLRESKDSSQIELIITTFDELMRSENKEISQSTKEVKNYATALKYGVDQLKKQNGISNNTLIEIVKIIKENTAGFRTTAGTSLVDQNNKIVYTPPQSKEEIIDLMTNLESYINDNSLENIDPLVKMSIIHYQFESIHPFYDGNGRVGRILNILYLILNDLLDLPILYLSEYINNHKADYYKLLQKTKKTNDFNEWIFYMLDAIESTSKNTIKSIYKIKELIQKQKQFIRNNFSKIYSQELLNTIFLHPYTKIEYIVKSVGVSRITATKYLNLLEKGGLLKIKKIGNINYYVNIELFEILQNKN